MTEWISRREKLPENDCLVIAVIEFRTEDVIEILKYSSDKVQWRWTDRNGKKYRERSVIWWMPLPEVPQ